ncbi:glycosyltransferase [Paraburkholderia phymatum]|uniref:Glycosyltransferase n=1 Tax=Paraburkholderia phymatum (strain DSM 17167 / CIP 108236 / LMG 21445 / STM815) TaxID=391038 RepID=B2JS49_PARP8|nr:glycosyltransferase [Paraburkholderia phymatum]ACC72426.1 conserved hypothetical protein [Paraburkholderia phymatum STM815]
MKVFILHSGNANYPEINAYSDFLSKLGIQVFSGDSNTYSRFPFKGECVLWCIMGFYRVHENARFIIHDYRSLSVRPLAACKDWIKQVMNAKPNLRAFQNERMRDVMNFRDAIPSVLLPMGVPDWIFDAADGDRCDSAHPTKGGRFCYIGEMSRERGFDKVLAAWRASPWKRENKFVLVGRPETSLYREFRNTEGLNFVGRVSQKDALDIVRRSEYAVCYFPYHRPHCFQTPTKMLEYAALGKKIICNDSPSNLAASRELGIHAFVAGRSIFDSLPFDGRELSVKKNEPDKLRRLAWTSVIEGAGILAFVRDAMDIAVPRRLQHVGNAL